jgi:hypothetical protein
MTYYRPSVLPPPSSYINKTDNVHIKVTVRRVRVTIVAVEKQ